MKTKFTSIFIFVSLLSALAGEKLIPAPKMIFEENKNQWPKQVMFEADFAGGKLFLEKRNFTYLFIENVNFHDFTRSDKGIPLVHYHSFKVNFINSNPEVDVTGSDLFSFHRNYFLGNDPGKWAEGVKLYGEVSYRNLYPSIDMNVYNVEQNLKYDLVVKPGGDPQNIKFDYEGTERMHLRNGNLYIQTSIGTVIEQKPFAYQIINGIKKEIACSYELKKQTLSFSIRGKYDKNYPLVIDPVLVASTYTGSYGDNWGFTATYDNAGNIYTAGIAASAGYPTTIGAWDNTFNGGMAWPSSGLYPFDISITKYNATGTTILFSTYYGGSQNEQPHSLFVNNNNQLYLTGRTNSPNFPSTIGAYDVTFNGGYDIIVGKFNSSGGLLASTFVGGSGNDGVNITDYEWAFGSLKFNYADDGRSEIILDNNSNVYVAGSTRSTNFPTSAGAYDNSLGGTQDGCLFKMNSSLSSLTFSTYLGGSADDAAYGLKLDGSNNIYVTGGTASADFPTTPGVLHLTFQGGIADAFITAINSSGTSLLYSTYLGTADYDQSYLIETDANNDIYVYGQTKGAYPVTAGVYSNPNSGQFIHKLNNQLNTTIFSTVIGTGTPNPNISPTAFLVDSCQSIYIAGWGRCAYAFGNPSPSTVTGMPITANAYKSVTDGCDFYFMVLRPNAQSLLYGTFFGENSAIGDHVDGGTSRFDKRGYIYQSVCASCGGSDGFPTTPSAWSTTNNNYNCNNAVIKMDLQVNPVAIANVTGAPSGCAPYTVPFNIAGSLGTNYSWDFGDGSPMVYISSPTHTYADTGTYIASLFVSDSTGTCGQIDTAEITVIVVGPPTLQTSQTSVFCNGGNNGTATVVPSGGLSPYTYLWAGSGQTSATTTGLSSGTYYVTVSNVVGCPVMDTVIVTQPPVLSVNTTFTNVGCFGGSNGTATATVSGGTAPYTYLWLPGGYTASSITGLSINTYSVNVTDLNGCTVSSPVNITQPPTLSITPTTVNATCGQPNGSATVTGTGGFAPYIWTWSGGQTGATVSGLPAGTYTVTIHDVNLCTSSLPVSIANTSGPTASISSVNVSCNGANNGSATIITTGGTLPFTYLWNNGQTTPTASNLAAGIYSVIATDVNNCSATASITITEPSLLIANAIGTNPTCFGFTNGSALVSSLGGSPPYSYLWAISGNPTTASVSGLGVGIYNVTVTDLKGCIKIASVTIVNPNPVVTFISNTSVLCVGDCNGTATATATNGFPPYYYLWNDPSHQTSAIATGLCAASYSVSVTDAHGCPSNAATTIGSPSLLTAVTSVGNTTCFELCDGFAQATPIGGTPPYSYNWMQGTSTTATASGLCAGAFTFTITDAHGCTAITTDTITQPNQLTGAVNVLKIPCNSICDGSITTSYSGGTPPYSYLWLPGLQTIYNPINLCAGSNTVTITDVNGCTQGGTVELTEPPPLTIDTSTTNSSCGQPNGGACVTVSGGTLSYSYLWNSSLTDTLNCVNGLLANTYNVTVTDGMGCTKTTNANINDFSGTVVTITASTGVSCFGLSNGTATASVAGGVPPYSFLWTPGGQTVMNPTNLSAGVNTITATDSIGCVGSASITIAKPPEIISAITGLQNVSCNGLCNGAANILYGGGVPPLSIVWDAPGSPTTSGVTGLCAGTYHVTITDANGCVKIDSSAIITQPAPLIIQSFFVSDIECNGDSNGVLSAVLFGGTPYYTYSWIPNISAGATAANLEPGSYTLNVTDYKGCTVTGTKSITEPPVLSVTKSSSPSACDSNTGSATLIPSGGTATYTYQWNDMNLQTTAIAQNLAPGSYVCTVSDSNNCTLTDTVIVLTFSSPMIDSIVTSNVLCYGDNTGEAKVFLTNGMGTIPFSYLWTPSSQTNDTAVGLIQGSYSVLISDANGCFTNGIVVVNQPPELLIMVSPTDTLCYLDTAQVYAQATGGSPDYIYNWLGVSGAGLSGSGPHIVTPASSTSYSVTVTDANGCSSATVEMQVIVPPPLSVVATSDVQICDGSSGTISATPSGGNGGPYTYVWSNGSTSQSQVVSPSIIVSPVNYIVTVDDGCSLPGSDTAIVTVQPNPTGFITESDSSGCKPLTVNFNAGSNNTTATYSWDFGDSTSGSGASISHTYVNENVYSVTLTVTSSAGCSTLVAGSTLITVNPLPNADFSINTNATSSVTSMVSFTDLSTVAIASWQWNFGDSTSSSNSSSLQNPSHTFGDGEAGTYTVQLIVTNQYGCMDTAYSEVTVYGDVVFPNVFTPNPNGSSGGAYSPLDLTNDVFFPYAHGVVEYKLQIFDRWGELIFESDNVKQGWDGYYRGKLCQEGVYIWKADIILNNGKVFNLSGDLTLLR